MENNIPLEIERKFLIKYPDIDKLSDVKGIRKIEMTQTYLICSKGTARVRKCLEDNKVTYTKTIKEKISDLTRIENEFVLSKLEYENELKTADPELRTITKTRYKIPYAGHILEIDIYPFWKKTAILEIELSSENEEYKVLPYIDVICEVSFDERYTNKSLALNIPEEIL